MRHAHIAAILLCLAPGTAPGAGQGSNWGFVDVTNASGAGSQFRFEFGYSETRDMMPAGVAAGDIDNDGDIDLIIPQGDYLPLRVLRNLGNGGFQSVAAQVGLNLTGNVAAGALLADLDNNGDLDLVLTGLRGFGTRLYLNQSGQYTEATAAWGLAGSTIDAYSAAAGDIDGDGWLDLAVSHWDNRTGAAPTSGHLWRNSGSGFTDIDVSSGINVAYTGPDYSFSPHLVDFDDDGDVDLLMASDFGTSKAFRNLGNGQFQMLDPLLFDDENGMGADVGDYDNDGDLDWFVSSIYDPAGVPVAGQGITGNRLYRNDGNGVFVDVSAAAGVRQGYWGWGSCFADFNQDGWLDIFHVNGMPFGNHPVFNADPSRLFVNQGDGTFVEQALTLGIDDTRQGRGIACFDYDRDGDIDIYIANNEGNGRLYRNDAPAANHGLGVRLRTGGANAQAVGARLRLRLDGQIQTRVLMAGSHFQSSSPVEAHFGLGPATRADALEIDWPDGRTTCIAEPDAQALLTVDDPDRVFATRD